MLEVDTVQPKNKAHDSKKDTTSRLSHSDYDVLKNFSRWLCSTCGRSLSSPAILRRHQKNHHKPPPAPQQEKPQPPGKDTLVYSCVLCQTEFTRKCLYAVHCQVKHQLQGVLRLVSI